MIASNSIRFVMNGDKLTKSKCAFGSRKGGQLEKENIWFCGKEVACGCLLFLIHIKAVGE